MFARTASEPVRRKNPRIGLASLLRSEVMKRWPMPVQPKMVSVITETIFGWTGMGHLFITSLRNNDANPILGFFLLTGSLAVLANIVADLVYAGLDPRIRVNA